MGPNFYDYRDFQKYQGGCRIMKHTVHPLKCCEPTDFAHEHKYIFGFHKCMQFGSRFYYIKHKFTWRNTQTT